MGQLDTVDKGDKPILCAACTWDVSTLNVYNVPFIAPKSLFYSCIICSPVRTIGKCSCNLLTPVKVGIIGVMVGFKLTVPH